MNLSYFLFCSFLFSLVIIPFLYLLFAFAIRWFVVSNFEKPKEKVFCPSWGEKKIPLIDFFIEYFICLFSLIFLVYDYGALLWITLWRRQPSYINRYSQKNPVLLIHGMMMGSSTLYFLKRRLKKNGWKNVYAIRYHQIGNNISDIAYQIEKTITHIETISGNKKVSLICHSMGGLSARYYISHLGGDKKVDKVITIGTPHKGSFLWCFSLSRCGRQMNPKGSFITGLNKLPEGVTGVSIYSDFDQMVIPNDCGWWKNGGNVSNIKVSKRGHLSLLYSKKVFNLIRVILDSPLK